LTSPAIGLMPANTKNIRAFSLIEAAIVLGVIGLVIGGLWAAASTVRFKMQVNEITTGIMLTQRNMATYKSTGTMWCATNQMNILPQAWLNNGNFTGPLGLGIDACMEASGLIGITLYPEANTQTFGQACAYFIPAIINGAGSSFDHATFNYDDAFNSITAAQTPVNFASAQFVCNDALNVQLFFK